MSKHSNSATSSTVARQFAESVWETEKSKKMSQTLKQITWGFWGMTCFSYWEKEHPSEHFAWEFWAYVSSTNFLKWFLVPKTNSTHTQEEPFSVFSLPLQQHYWLLSEAIIQIDRALGNYTEVENEESVWVGENVTKVAKSPENIQIILSYPLVGLFEYLFMFWLHRQPPAKQVLNSKQSAQGYERIIREILRRSGYFSKTSVYMSCLPMK